MIPESYVVGSKSLADFFVRMRSAGVPPRVTFEFLKTLGFRSSNDRAIISVLKAIGFLDASGTPTETYRQFRDPKAGPAVLAQAIRQAYADIFLANERAETLSLEELKGIIATKTTKGERVVTEIARTFVALAKAADFDVSPDPQVAALKSDDENEPNVISTTPAGQSSSPAKRIDGPMFHYNIQIHLPTTTDVSVYNAIFKSLRDNLL